MGLTVELELPTRAEVGMACRHVLYVLNDDREVGIEPGGFTTDLILLLTHADQENLSKLSLGFGAYATAVNIFKNEPDGPGMLARLATQTPIPQPGDGSTPKGN